MRRLRPAELGEAVCTIGKSALIWQTSDALARPVAAPPYPMMRPIPTLHGTALAVSALLIATAALAFDAGRAVCPHAPVQTAHLTRTAS